MKKEENKTQNRMIERGERGGAKAGRIAWPEKVALCMVACGTEKQGLWFTHKAIQKRLKDQGYSGAPKNIHPVLRGLVKSGYLERAKNPKDQGHIYRRTAKPFKAEIMGQGFRNGTKIEDLNRGFQRRLDHPRLPKWFRDMME